MSKIASHKLSDGDSQTKSPNHALKNRKKPMKSNITSKMRTRRADIVAPGDDEGQDDDGDSNADDEDDGTVDDPDVSALPSAHSQDGGETRKRLAGQEPKQQAIFGADDIAQTVAGADEDSAKICNDDDYVGVENVSDVDEFGEPVDDYDSDDSDEALKAAEQELIDEFERTEPRRIANGIANDMTFMALDEEQALARRLSLQGSDSQTDECGLPINLDNDPFYGFGTGNNMYQDMLEEAEGGLWGMPDTFRIRESSDPASATQKRVRFEEVQVDSSSGSDSEDPNDAYPDLLDAADVPGLKQRIALGLKLDESVGRTDFNDAESFYDFEDEDERRAFQIDEESDSGEDMSSSDSDDEGDTTDEEPREEQIARMKERRQAVGKPSNQIKQLPATHNGNRTASKPSTPRPATPKGSSKTLKLGTFTLDPTRATMTSDSDGKNIKLLPPATPLAKDKAFWERAKTASSSRDGSPGNSFITRPTPGADSMPARPFTTESTLGMMFQGNLDILRNNDVSGIVDDSRAGNLSPTFIPAQTSFISTTTIPDSDTDIQEDINMQDFIDFSDSGSETDEQQVGIFSSPAHSTSFDPLMEMDTPSRHVSDLMGHFDQYRGVVGSFRRNQHQARQVSSQASHPAKRASAHEYNALQKGRRGAANTPITPARKKRASQDLTPNNAGVRKSINSPLTARRPRSRGNSLVGISANSLYQTLAGNPFDAK